MLKTARFVSCALLIVTSFSLFAQPGAAQSPPQQPQPPAAGPLANTATVRRYLPFVRTTSTCPTASNASYNLVPVDGSPADHPDYLHGDLNLALRGYSLTSAPLGLVDYAGGMDVNAPRLHDLFEPNRIPAISHVYRVNNWNWSPSLCGGAAHGCPGAPITNWPVTLAGFATTPGEPIYIPERAPEIFGGGYKVLVLYAEARRITLVYTRFDTVAVGYAVHIENVCVDPELLALYRAQVNAQGWRATHNLPALKNNQALGTAAGTEIQVAIRDSGAFLDPRSRKDWWQQ